jgi:ribosomal protein S18 acetylase RimI-like enzyme
VAGLPHRQAGTAASDVGTTSVPRAFLGYHLIAERAGRTTGFHSAGHADEAYIHFAGVEPGARRNGLGRRMCEHFFAVAVATGRTTDTGSVAFHTRLGLTVTLPEPGGLDQRLRLARVLDQS